MARKPDAPANPAVDVVRPGPSGAAASGVLPAPVLPAQRPPPRVMSEGPLVGQIVGGHFRVASKIFDTATGEAYLADQLRPGSEAIVRRAIVRTLRRELASGREVASRLERELRGPIRVTHHNVAAILATGDLDGGQVFVASEYGGDHSLRDLLNQEGRLSVDHALYIASQICAGLDALHAGDTLHRDVRPTNIFITRRGSDEVVKVADAGFLAARTEVVGAKLPPPAKTATGIGVFVGTPAYASPEQARGTVLDARSDLYSVGVVLFEMITGRLPFTSADPQGYIAMHAGTPPPRPSVGKAFFPEPVEKLVLKALDKHPARRFQSASAMREAIDDLRRFVRALPPDAFPPLPTKVVEAPRKVEPKIPTPKWVWAVLAVGLTIATLFAVLLVVGAPPPPDSRATTKPVAPVAPAPPVAPTPEAPVATPTFVPAVPGALEPPPPPRQAPTPWGFLEISSPGGSLSVVEDEHATRHVSGTIVLAGEAGQLKFREPDARWEITVDWKRVGAMAEATVHVLPAGKCYRLIGTGDARTREPVDSAPVITISNDRTQLAFSSPEQGGRELILYLKIGARVTP